MLCWLEVTSGETLSVAVSEHLLYDQRKGFLEDLEWS